MQKLRNACETRRLSGQLQRYPGILCSRGQAAHRLLRQGVQIGLLPLHVPGSLIQMGKADDVRHKPDQPLGLSVDFACKGLNIFRLDHTVL